MRKPHVGDRETNLATLRPCGVRVALYQIAEKLGGKEKVFPIRTEYDKPSDDARRNILVVDDEELVIDFVASTLAQANYQVITANGPDLAILASRHYQRTVHLLLTHYQMPGTTGTELAKALTKDRPEIRVLVMSGRDRDQITPPENARFIQKPFASAALLDLVAEILSTVVDLPEKVPVQRELGKPSNEDRTAGRA
jgi:DNA-binding NtrC family response regulator